MGRLLVVRLSCERSSLVLLHYLWFHTSYILDTLYTNLRDVGSLVRNIAAAANAISTVRYIRNTTDNVINNSEFELDEFSQTKSGARMLTSRSSLLLFLFRGADVTLPHYTLGTVLITGVDCNLSSSICSHIRMAVLVMVGAARREKIQKIVVATRPTSICVDLAKDHAVGVA